MPVSYPTLQAQQFIIAPPGWDKGWNIAKAAAGSAVANIHVMGDSTTQGNSLITSSVTTSWIARLRTLLLNAGYAQGGDMWHPGMCQAFYTGLGFGTYPGTPPFASFVGTNAPSFNFTPWGTFCYFALGAVAGGFTFTCPYACTDIDLMAMNYTTNNWSYKVDGGGANTVTVASSDTTNPPFQVVPALTSGASSAHTVAVTVANAGNINPMFLGVKTYVTNAARTQGLSWVWGGSSAASLCTYLLGISPPPTSQPWPRNPALMLQGAQSGAGTAQPKFPAKPDLLIIAMSINEAQNLGARNGYGPEGYRRGLARVISAARRGNQNCSVILLAMSFPDQISSDSTGGYNHPDAYPRFLDVMKNVSRDYNCAFVNVHAAWGSTGVAQGFQTVGDPHPNDAGMTDIANRLYSIL